MLAAGISVEPGLIQASPHGAGPQPERDVCRIAQIWLHAKRGLEHGAVPEVIFIEDVDICFGFGHGERLVQTLLRRQVNSSPIRQIFLIGVVDDNYLW